MLQVDKESARKELVLSERQAKLTQAVQKFKDGQVVKGQIQRIEDYGALVNIFSKGKPTGVQGLLHKSELSWDLVMHVDDVVQEGESHLHSSDTPPSILVYRRRWGILVAACCLFVAFGLGISIIKKQVGSIFCGRSLRDDGSATGPLHGVECMCYQLASCWLQHSQFCHALPTGQELDLKVVSIDVPRCRVGLSLRQMQQDPLQTTMDSIQWRETVQAPAEVEQIIQVLELTAGINSVKLGRQAEEPHTVAQVRAPQPEPVAMVLLL